MASQSNNDYDYDLVWEKSDSCDSFVVRPLSPRTLAILDVWHPDTLEPDPDPDPDPDPGTPPVSPTTREILNLFHPSPAREQNLNYSSTILHHGKSSKQYIK